MTPSRIMLNISRDPLQQAGDYTYIILGKTGPTGKTWLCNELRVHGYDAFEIAEDVNHAVEYVNDDTNSFIVNHTTKQVTIILNERLKEK